MESDESARFKNSMSYEAQNEAPKFALLLIATFYALLFGCSEAPSNSPRSAWGKSMAAYAERNYGGLWDMLSDISRQDTIRVLAHVKKDPKYRATMRSKFQISSHRLDTMGPREFFIALMTGVERASPEMIRRRAHSAKTAVFENEEILDGRALVSWNSEIGGSESMQFVLEGGRWKPIVERRIAN